MSTPVYLYTYLESRQTQPRGLMACFACMEVTLLKGRELQMDSLISSPLIVGCSSNLKSIKGNVYYSIYFFFDIISYLLYIYIYIYIYIILFSKCRFPAR